MTDVSSLQRLLMVWSRDVYPVRTHTTSVHRKPTHTDRYLAYNSHHPQSVKRGIVYRKPTHTDQYLAYNSHHPQSVKRGIVKFLYDRAKRLVTKPSVIAGEKKHLSSVFVSNGYRSSFVQKITKARTTPRREPVAEFKSTAVLPYVQGVSESLRRCLEQQAIRTVFKSDTTLRSHLV